MNMKGYLLREQDFVPGEDTFIECLADMNSNGVVFEDNTETGFFYAIEKDSASGEMRVLDALHIYNAEDITDKQKRALKIIWSKSWQQCALVIDTYCYALFDFEGHGGYNRNEFPPPNEFWTRHGRKLTNEVISSFFE